MITALQELPHIKVGTILELPEGTWAVTDIIQVIKNSAEDMQPQITFQVVCVELKEKTSN